MLSPGTKTLAALACTFSLACGASPVPSESNALSETQANPCGDQPCANSSAETEETENLPSQVGEVEPEGLVISLQGDGQIMVNEKAVEDVELDRIFLENFTRDPNTEVLLTADPSVSHGLVVSVIDRAKKAGLSKMKISANSSTPE